MSDAAFLRHATISVAIEHSESSRVCTIERVGLGAIDKTLYEKGPESEVAPDGCGQAYLDGLPSPKPLRAASSPGGSTSDPPAATSSPPGGYRDVGTVLLLVVEEIYAQKFLRRRSSSWLTLTGGL